MFSFSIKFVSNKPLYEQLYEHIKKQIHDRSLRPGEKLPSKRTLAHEIGLSVQTVVIAYEQMIAEGYLLAKEKKGYYVCQMPAYLFDETEPRLNEDAKKEPKKYLFDFQTALVDPDHFPYLEWARLEKDVILDDMHNAINTVTLNGYEPLLEAISRYIRRYRGIITNPRNIIIGSGSESLITIVRLLIGIDVLIGVENPGYLKTTKIYNLNNMKTRPIPLDGAGMIPSEILRAKADLIHVTPSHQFPSGLVMPVNRRLELLEWAREDPNRYIIEDDYDSEFRFAGRPIPALAGLEGSDRVIYINSFTKSIAPSLRISFMVLPEHLRIRFEKEHPYYTCPVSLIGQVALERFMSKGSFERHLNRMKIIYRTKRDLLISALKESSFAGSFQIEGEEAGLHFLLKFKDRISEFKLIETAKKNGVRVYGLAEYLLEEIPHQTTIIMGYSALAEEDIKKAVERLKTAWQWLN